MLDDSVQSQLISLCTKDGTAEQARNAVRTLASLHGHDLDKRVEVFQVLLETMTSSTRLSVYNGEKANKKVVNVLETLTAIVECVPSLFSPVDKRKKSRGMKAVRFALETVLLGRRDRISDYSHENLDFDDDDEIDAMSTNNSYSGKKKTKTKSPKNGEASPSLACKRICASITFLVAYIRTTKKARLSPPKQYLSAIFAALQGILQDGGKPPSLTDRQECQEIEDMVALRQCATISMMRLCDGNLQLQNDYFTCTMWHVLGKSFVDADASVRGELQIILSIHAQFFC